MKGIAGSVDLYLWAVIYFLLTLFLKWQFSLQIEILFYLAGIVVGLHLLQLVTVLFKTSNTPFHTLLCHLILTIATFYVVTSSNSLFGKGAVLSLSLRYFYLLISEFRRTKNLASWFGQSLPLPEYYNRSYLYVTIILFGLVTFLFIRS